MALYHLHSASERLRYQPSQNRPRARCTQFPTPGRPAL